MFLTLENIDGEAVAVGFENTIDVLSWSWSVVRADGGSGIATGRIDARELRVVKNTDAATADLLATALTSLRIPTGSLSVRRNGIFDPYLVIDMDNIIITRVAQGGSATGGPLTETISLAYERICTTYNRQEADGSADGPPETTCWDVVEQP
jgi:type VI protein secretion system component Hcp